MRIEIIWKNQTGGGKKRKNYYRNKSGCESSRDFHYLSADLLLQIRPAGLARGNAEKDWKNKKGGGGVIWKGETVLLKISAATGFCLPASCVYFQGSPLHRPFPHSRFIVKNKSCWTFLWLVLRANGKDISRGGQCRGCGRNGGHRWSPQTSVLRSH